MHFGAAIFFTDYSIGPVELARALEERGYESLWAPSTRHIPLLAQIAVPAGRRPAEEILRRHGPVRDAGGGGSRDAATKLGTGICLVIQRDPIQTAKRWQASTRYPAGASCSASAPDGMPRRWPTTAREFKTRFK